MCEMTVRLAAANIQQAVKKFTEWDKGDSGIQGYVGHLVHWGTNFQGREMMVRPTQITSEHITKRKDLRASRLTYSSVKPSVHS
jgi:hypothetical protein